MSANLHLWIDLIFGYKQQGPAAVEALNTFHPYFYTDKHDAESMKNPLKKSTVLGYISNFGQIPKQVLSNNLINIYSILNIMMNTHAYCFRSDRDISSYLPHLEDLKKN